MSSVKSYAVVILGRVVFGLTGESLSVTQSNENGQELKKYKNELFHLKLPLSVKPN